MLIQIKDKKLAKYANSERELVKAYGTIMAKKIRIRLDDLKAAVSLEDVRYLPGNYHELIGNRKGLWACDVDQPYRLIFEPTEKPIPVDNDEKYIWKEIFTINILEITNYHKS